MNKNRLISMILIFFLLPMCLSAAFLQLGPTYTIDFPIDKEAEKPVDFEALDFASYHVGADTRMNIGFLQLKGDAIGLISEDLRIEAFDFGASVGLRTDLKYVEFITGVGARVNISNDEGKWTFNGGEYKGIRALGQSASLFYRASFGINFGKKVCLTTEAVFPLDLTVGGLYEVQDRSIVEAFTPDLKKTTVSVGLLFRMI